MMKRSANSAKYLVARVWNSPTSNTWTSFVAKSMALVFVVPLVLRLFSAGDAALWFVFSSLASIAMLVGVGFAPTFARMLAFARAGLPIEQMSDVTLHTREPRGNDESDLSLSRLFTCMRAVFLSLGALSIVALATVGSYFVARSISVSSDPKAAWWAWGIIVAVSGLTVCGNVYSAFLLGFEKVALVRRLETVATVIGICFMLAVLLLGGGLFALVLGYQLSLICGVALLWAAFRAEPNSRNVLGWRHGIDRAVFAIVWGAAWRSGTTSLLSTGLIQATTVIQAQYGNPALTATYALTSKVASAIGYASQAPFVSKLPTLAKLRAQGALVEQLSLVRRGIGLTYICLISGIILYAMLGPLILKIIGSQSAHFDLTLWGFFALNLFFERYSAMLLQVRNLTNKPVEHVAALGYVIINISVIVVGLPHLGMYTFPIAMLSAQLLCAVWVAGAYGYRALGVRPLTFERGLGIPAFAILLLGILIFKLAAK